MENALDNFYLQKEEPIRSCLLAMREIILSQDVDVSAAWKYGMPFFATKAKCFVTYGFIKNTNNRTLVL